MTGDLKVTLKEDFLIQEVRQSGKGPKEVYTHLYQSGSKLSVVGWWEKPHSVVFEAGMLRSVLKQEQVEENLVELLGRGIDDGKE